MKKLIFAAFAAGAMVLAGCTKVEVKNVPENRAIGFDNFVSNSVKSIDNSQALKKFYVFGGTSTDIDIFANEEMSVSWNSNDATVTYSPQRFWTANTDYQFAAYSNDNTIIDGVTLATPGTIGTIDALHLSIPYTTDGTTDLVYAQSDKTSYNWNGADDPETVNFTFYHVLSNIQFQFTKGTDLDDITVAISELKFTSIKTNGIFTGTDLGGSTQYPFTTWNTTSGNSGNQDVTFTTNSTNDNSGTINSVPLYLIPQTANSLEITFTLTPTSTETTGLQEKSFKVTLPAPGPDSNNNWNPGNSYIYTATITAETFNAKPIVFDVTEVKDWTENTVDIEDDINMGQIE